MRKIVSWAIVLFWIGVTVLALATGMMRVAIFTIQNPMACLGTVGVVAVVAAVGIVGAKLFLWALDNLH